MKCGSMAAESSSGSTAWRLALTQDLINDVRERGGGVDRNTVLRNAFLCLMQPLNEFPFGSSSAPIVFRSRVQPPVQCVKVDCKDKNSVEQANEL